MATGRTISAGFLTDFDRSVILLCENISNSLKDLIPDKKSKKEFVSDYGKISYTRDGGMGLGGGKLQRDALCTRGRQGKAPWSNRNLRWHPLVISKADIHFATTIDSISVDEEESVLVFNITDEHGTKISVRSEDVHKLTRRYTATTEQWEIVSNIVKSWKDTEWTKNSCCIPSAEACEWYDAVEAYAVLGIAIASEKYKANFDLCYGTVLDILSKQSVNVDVKLPTTEFPTSKADIISDPMTKMPISSKLDEFRFSDRQENWNPNWATSKRAEGDDSSLQISHVEPLIETEIRHKAKNVRYGFRWSNIAMTDHSIDETLAFMERIVNAHKED